MGELMSKIMLIEDDQTMLALLKILLGMENFEVYSPVDDRPEAIIEAIRDQHPDLTLLDVNLRLGNGIELVSQMRSDPELKGARVIMTSGLDLSNECLQAGADNFLLKPSMPDDLINITPAHTSFQ
jgi:DNA-binding response OmpR family regulator